MKKVEVTIRNSKGEVTFYAAQKMKGDKITIPMGDILKAQKKGIKRGKQSVH